MSGKMSRDKGARGEREAAKVLAEATGFPVDRSARIGKVGAADLVGLPGFCIEVKYLYGTPVVNQWWKQAVRQADGETPLLMYRLRGHRVWTVRISARYFLPELPVESWVEMPVDTFGAIIRMDTQ